MSSKTRQHLINRIADDLLDNTVAVAGRWNILRVYGRERFTDGLYEDLAEDIDVALEGYAEVGEIRLTGHDNSHKLVILLKGYPTVHTT